MKIVVLLIWNAVGFQQFALEDTKKHAVLKGLSLQKESVMSLCVRRIGLEVAAVSARLRRSLVASFV